MPVAMAMTFFSAPPASTPMRSRFVYRRSSREPSRAWSSVASAWSADAMTAAAGRPIATSRANVGPDRTASGALGNRSRTSSLIRRWRAGSNPLVADTTAARGDGVTRVSVAAKNSDGTARTTRSASASAVAASAVASTLAGISRSERYQGLRRRAAMASATWAPRA